MAAHALSRTPVTAEAGDLSAEPEVTWAPINSRILTGGQRRLEASTFLTDGYGLRRGLEQLASTVRIRDIAEVWQPSRLKGYTVDAGKGLPFLSAGQVFESQPRIRKWLAEAMVPAVETRHVDDSWILLSCSGEVGRVTAVYPEHLGKVVTHDLLRVVPEEREAYGWLYAYMKTPTFFAIARSSQYGHMIKHLEPEHVLAMPVAMPNEAVRLAISKKAERALTSRRDARKQQARADRLYARLINPTDEGTSEGIVSIVRTNELWSGRRRLEGQFHRDEARRIERLVHQSADQLEPLGDLVESIGLGARFKRYFGANGTPYRSASELFDVNPDVTKRIYAALLPDADRYLLHPGWIIMVRSGQTYGLLGRTTVLTERHEGVFGSDDLIRIKPDGSRVLTGFLQTALNHAEYGRPRVVRYASGTSIPHLDPVDVRQILIPRFSKTKEREIAELSSRAVELSAQADQLESEAIREAEAAVATLTRRHG